MLTGISFALAFAISWDIQKFDQSAPESIHESIRKSLDDYAWQIKDSDGVKMNLWFRTGIPAKATKDQVKNGLTIRELAETAIVGIVEFKADWIDYRKQTIPAGVYTLRLAFQPDTADHKETAPATEFLLLSKVADDQSLDEIDVKTLIERSRKATGGDHPGVMLLVKFKSEKADPVIVDVEKVGKVVMVKRAVIANGEEISLGFGITISGSSEKR